MGSYSVTEVVTPEGGRISSKICTAEREGDVNSNPYNKLSFQLIGLVYRWELKQQANHA